MSYEVLQKEADLREEIQEKLQREGVPGELIRSWARLEAKAVVKLQGDGCKLPEPLPAQVREVAFRFLHSLMDVAGLPDRGVNVLDCVLLLDFYHFSGGVSVGSLPAVCAAIVALLKKSATSTARVCLNSLVGHSSQFTVWLSGLGYDTSKVDIDEVKIQESAVLEALGWQINRPSVNTWITVLCGRFDILTFEEFAANMKWVKQTAEPLASFLVLSNTPDAAMTLTPRRMANGIFCLRVAVAGLLDGAELRPEDVCDKAWEDLFCRSQGVGTMPRCGLTEGGRKGVLTSMKLATGCEDMSTLRSDALAVAQAIVGRCKPKPRVIEC